MKKIRVKLILITLVCYYIFIATVPDFLTNRELNQNNKAEVITNFFSEKRARVKRIDYGPVMDPTPLPPSPPNIEQDTQFLD